MRLPKWAKDVWVTAPGCCTSPYVSPSLTFQLDRYSGNSSMVYVGWTISQPRVEQGLGLLMTCDDARLPQKAGDILIVQSKCFAGSR